MPQVGALLAVPLVERIERKYLITGGLTLIGVAGITFGTSTSEAVIVLAGVTIRSPPAWCRAPGVDA